MERGGAEAAASGGRKRTRGQEVRDLQERPNRRAFGDAGGARRAGHGVNG